MNTLTIILSIVIILLLITVMYLYLQLRAVRKELRSYVDAGLAASTMSPEEIQSLQVHARLLAAMEGLPSD
jgi:hypothetical protein